jgi:hypothetical protein
MRNHDRRAAKSVGAALALARVGLDLIESDDLDHSNVDTAAYLLAQASTAAYAAGLHLRLGERESEPEEATET